MYKDSFINDLNNRMKKSPFFHMTGSKDEKEYIRNNDCTYVIIHVYGGLMAKIKSKKTNECIEIPLYLEV